MHHISSTTIQLLLRHFSCIDCYISQMIGVKSHLCRKKLTLSMSVQPQIYIRGGKKAKYCIENSSAYTRCTLNIKIMHKKYLLHTTHSLSIHCQFSNAKRSYTGWLRLWHCISLQELLERLNGGKLEGNSLCFVIFTIEIF